MNVPLVRPARIDWAALAARVRPPVGLPDRVVCVGDHVEIRTRCDADECTCGGRSSCACSCGERRLEPVAATGRLPHAIEHALWRDSPRPAWSTRPYPWRHR